MRLQKYGLESRGKAMITMIILGSSFIALNLYGDLAIQPCINPENRGAEAGRLPQVAQNNENISHRNRFTSSRNFNFEFTEVSAK
jgi:hypothetical protein